MAEVRSDGPTPGEKRAGADDGSRSGTVAVRPAEPSDAHELAVVHVRAWQAAYQGLISQQYLDNLDVVERTAAWGRGLGDAGSGVRVLVAEVDGRVVGFVNFGRARDVESEADGEVYAINVHPDHWQVGAGSALLTAAQRGLADLGYRRAVLWVLPGNTRARRFYQRFGWAAEGVDRTRDVQGATVPEVRYGRPLP
jgi:RimJ/RimL family protein N-acetyltransferase